MWSCCKGVGKKIDLPYGIVAYNGYKNLILTNNKVTISDNDFMEGKEYPLIEEPREFFRFNQQTKWSD